MLYAAIPSLSLSPAQRDRTEEFGDAIVLYYYIVEANVYCRWNVACYRIIFPTL